MSNFMPRDYGIHSIEEYLGEKKPLIPENHVKRIKEIQKYKMIYAGERDLLTQYYKNELIKYGVFKDNNFNAMMIIPNYCRKNTNDVVETSISTPPIITSTKKQDNNKIQAYLKTTEILSRKLQQIFINVHITGNCFVRIINDGKKKIPQILGTEQCFIVTDIMTNETTAYIVYTLYQEVKGKNKKDKAKILISERGRDTLYEADINSGYMYNIKLINKTEYDNDDFSILNFVVNPMIDNYEYGISAYSDADAIQSNLIRNINILEVVVEKFSQPILTGPAINQDNEDENDDIKYVQLVNDGVLLGQQSARKDMELAGKYVVNESEKDLKYVEYHGAIQETLSFIEMLKGEVIEALGGDELLRENMDLSRVDSSKAYRMLFFRLLNTCDKYTNAMTETFKKLIARLVNVSKEEEISVIWQEGLPDFVDERVEYATNRINNGTFSVVDAIAYIDDISNDEATKKADKIKNDNENLKNINENYQKSQNNINLNGGAEDE